MTENEEREMKENVGRKRENAQKERKKETQESQNMRIFWERRE